MRYCREARSANAGNRSPSPCRRASPLGSRLGRAEQARDSHPASHAERGGRLTDAARRDPPREVHHQPCAAARRRVVGTAIAAPSLMPLELPAVTVPPATAEAQTASGIV
jgi:hypothetical protein